MEIPFTIAALLRRVPLPIVRTATRHVFARAIRRHPGLFDRLGEHAHKRFAFVVTDLRLCFVVEPHRKEISVDRRIPAHRASSVVSGPILTLLSLLEGRIDGDAIFFSRGLTVSGDMEAVLALRNALDDCNFDLPRDITTGTGPLGEVAGRVAALIRDRALSGRI